jgi:hypothetical protein
VRLVAAIASLAVGLLGCARSFEDRELDRIFAHQAAMRDTTGTLVGRVIDSASAAPLGGVLVSAAMLGGITDTTGAFVVPYLAHGVQTVVAERRGYLAKRVEVTITPPDTADLKIRLARAPLARYELEGRWGVELVLDSTGLRQHPTARRLEGELVLSQQFPSPWGLGRDTDPRVRTIEGRYEVDLSPFWGAQVAPDVSTTVFGPTGPAFTKEASAATFNDDSISVVFIPRMSHGGIALNGRLVHADTAVGEWFQRAYCCGASGRFRLWRISRDPGPITLPLPVQPSKPDTLAKAERADVRVRIWDEASGRYIRGTHDVRFPDGSSQILYTTGTEPGGWGRSFWLPPGRYSISVNSYPCGSERYFLKPSIERPFAARAGEAADLTIRINTRTLKPARSYNNPDGLRCRVAQHDSTAGGA